MLHKNCAKHLRSIVFQCDHWLSTDYQNCQKVGKVPKPESIIIDQQLGDVKFPGNHIDKVIMRLSPKAQCDQ